MQRRASRSVGSIIAMLVVSVALIGAGVAAGLMIAKKRETGRWQIPTKKDLVDVTKKVVPVETDPVVPKIIYLRREPIELFPGRDNSRKRTSSIVKSSKIESAKMPGFSGSSAQWQKIVKCIDATFKPFDLTITDVEPGPNDGAYILVAVGGDAQKHLHRSNGHHFGGLAPFNGDLIEDAVVFVFADRLRNSLRSVCNTAAMEVAHAYGLDHLYNCQDVMTYLPDCGPKYFRDKDVPCGENKPRTCQSGKATQNSYRFLASVVGVREPAKSDAANVAPPP